MRGPRRWAEPPQPPVVEAWFWVHAGASRLIVGSVRRSCHTAAPLPDRHSEVMLFMEPAAPVGLLVMVAEGSPVFESGPHWFQCRAYPPYLRPTAAARERVLGTCTSSSRLTAMAQTSAVDLPAISTSNASPDAAKALELHTVPDWARPAGGTQSYVRQNAPLLPRARSAPGVRSTMDNGPRRFAKQIGVLRKAALPEATRSPESAAGVIAPCSARRCERQYSTRKAVVR